MNCKHAQLLLSAYQDKELSPVETSTLETHLKSCGACQSELQQVSRAWEMLGSLRTIEPSGNFKARFWDRVRQEESKPGLWDWITWPRLAPALAGVMAFWILGIGSSLFLFERHPVPSVRETSAALSIFTSSYPPNSIEQIYLQGSSNSHGQGGHV